MFKPNIGLLGLTLELYDSSLPELRSGREVFARRLIKMMENDINFCFPGACNTRESVEKAVARFESEGCDAILVIFLTYAPSLIALPALFRTKLPVIIWNTQEATGILADSGPGLMMENHGVHGVQDLTSALRRSGRNFRVITGHWRDAKAIHRLIMLFRAARAVSVLRKSRIALLGYPMQDMGDFCVDETAFLAKIGPAVIHISIDELANLVEKAPEGDLGELMAEDRKHFDWDDMITSAEHEGAARLEWAIRRLISDYHLNAWAQHFMALAGSNRISILPFLAASKLMAEGVGYGAEGDVTVAAGCILMRELAKESTFVEMFTMDFEEQALFMRHMGELNIAMARRDVPVKVIRKPFHLVKMQPIPTPVFALRPGEATICSLTTGPKGSFRLVVAEGEVLDIPCYLNIGAPNFKWRPNCKLEEFLDRFAEVGGSHHQALGYGRLGEAIEAVAGFLGIEAFHIG
ncbi:MAG: L-fucose/L-arabinose isomerase family protein [Firmicutes bacterium]|nr:L-fucose/L-arabinose isomerase family protein [Bacillota bacterium]